MLKNILGIQWRSLAVKWKFQERRNGQWLYVGERERERETESFEEEEEGGSHFDVRC